MSPKIPIRLLLLFALAPPFSFASAQHLQIYSEDFPPFNYIVNGKPTGVAVAVFNELQSELGLDLKINFAPWPRIFSYVVHRPNVAVFSMARNPSREDKVKWVGPIASYSTAFYAARHSNIRVTNIEQAKAVPSIGVVKGAEPDEIFNARGFTNLRPIGKAELGLRQLLHGRISLWLESVPTVKLMLNKYDIPESELLYQLHGHTGYLYLVFSKQTDDETVDQWRAALKRVKADGRFGAILMEHGMELPPEYQQGRK